MKSLLLALLALLVIGVANWAYSENYATQTALREVESLNKEIAVAREQLGVLRAEWAYLNRPDRLRDLVELNFDVLRLMPFSASHFGDAEQVSYPPINLNELSEPIDLSAETGNALAEMPE